MKILLLLSFLSLPLFASTECEVKRGLLDIGSGTIKLLVAEVNKCENRVIKVLSDSEAIAISHKQDLVMSGKKKSFSEAVMTRGVLALKELKKKGDIFAPTEWRAIATAAFREAKNGTKYGAKIEETLGIPLSVITQNEEALLGHSAVLENNPPPPPVCVWDIGGGSMQITTLNKSGTPVIYGSDVASVSFKNMVIEKIKKESILNTNTPNPLGLDGAMKAKKLAAELATKNIKGEIKSYLQNCKMIGIGGVHYHSLRKSTATTDKFTIADLEKALNTKAAMGDKEIGGDYANTDVSNIALVLGFMESMKVNEVYPVSASLSYGALLFKNFWKN